MSHTTIEKRDINTNKNVHTKSKAEQHSRRHEQHQLQFLTSVHNTYHKASSYNIKQNRSYTVIVYY